MMAIGRLYFVALTCLAVQIVVPVLVAGAGSTGLTTSPVRRVIRLGRDRVINIGPWTSTNRKTNRRADLWLYYKHGVVDHFAVPFRFEDLLGKDQPADKWLDRNQPIRNPYKESTEAAIRCVGSEGIELARPLPIDMERSRGKRVRIFFWMKGEDAGARNSTWHCPDADTIVKDGEGRVLTSGPFKIKCQRTFPWHCFYKDIFVTEKAAGIYMRLYNKYHGTAWFSTPSWELVGEQNSYSKNERQDPYTGSLSDNPLYEPLAHHFWHGFASKYQWRFVLGSKIGMKGHTYDITTKEGLSRYYFEKAKKDPGEMNHGVLHLRSMYYTGMKNKCLPPLEEGWLEHLGKIIIEDQDPETGYWHDGKSLSLGLTFHFCSEYFRYYNIRRSDRADRIDPSRNFGEKRVPRAEQIIRTTLMMQSSYVDDHGVKRKAAWNEAAYRYTTEPDKGDEKCWLPSTWDAIYLMRLAARYVDADLQEEVYHSVKAAFRYVLHKMVYQDGTFRQKDTDDHPTRGGYMYQIMEDSSWLERRIVPDLPGPKVELVRNGDEITVVWRAPAEEHNSLRIYAAPKGTAVKKVDESYLVGVVHKTGRRVYEMDPFLAVQKIRRAMVKRWGGSMELPPPTSWRGKKYLPWKLRRIHYPLAYSDDLKPLTITVKDAATKDIYVSAATWYGEECPAATLRH